MSQATSESCRDIDELSFTEFYKRFYKICRKHGATITKLPNGGYIAKIGKFLKKNKKIAFLAGVHGDERSGPGAILHWLETTKTADLIPEGCGLWICPLVNDVGWARNKHLWKNLNLNRYFSRKMPSPKFVKKIMKSLAKFEPSIFIDFHEDCLVDFPYIFRYVKGYDDFSKRLQKKIKAVDEPYSKMSYWEGCSETFAYHLGTKIYTTVESPTFSWSLKRRVNFNLNAIDYALQELENNNKVLLEEAA